MHKILSKNEAIVFKGTLQPLWELLLTQRQDSWGNHLAHIAISPNQQGLFEKKEEVSSPAEAQLLDTNSCELTNLENVNFFAEIPQMGLVVVFRPETDIPFSPSAFREKEMIRSAANLIVMCWMGWKET